MYGQRSPGLARRHQLDRVDVDPLWLSDNPAYDLGDVLCSQWVGARVHARRSFRISVEPHDGEFRLRHPWLDARDADPRAEKVGAEVPRELLHERLGRAVGVAAVVWPRGSDGANVDDVPAIALDHPGQ